MVNPAEHFLNEYSLGLDCDYALDCTNLFLY